MTTTDEPLAWPPDVRTGEVVVPAPDAGPGNWSGAASAVLVDDTFWLTYRVRLPLARGRGVSVIVARSSDGVHFERVTRVDREMFGAESFERPVLVPVPGVGWRLYLSCATPGSKHWWVDSLTASTVEGLPGGQRRVILAGDETVAVKDPVIVPPAAGSSAGSAEWEMWLCCHPLTEPGHEDRMTTRRLTSADGLAWVDRGEVLSGRPGEWDERGARVAAVLSVDPLTVLYDGRPSAEDNWRETTGVARWDGHRLVPEPGPPVRSPHSDGAWRYASVVRLPDGRARLYVEAARADGAHELLTFVS